MQSSNNNISDMLCNVFAYLYYLQHTLINSDALMEWWTIFQTPICNYETFFIWGSVLWTYPNLHCHAWISLKEDISFQCWVFLNYYYIQLLTVTSDTTCLTYAVSRNPKVYFTRVLWFIYHNNSTYNIRNAVTIINNCT